jgi:hypothetical protein
MCRNLFNPSNYDEKISSERTAAAGSSTAFFRLSPFFLFGYYFISGEGNFHFLGSYILMPAAATHDHCFLWRVYVRACSLPLVFKRQHLIR